MDEEIRKGFFFFILMANSKIKLIELAFMDYEYLIFLFWMNSKAMGGQQNDVQKTFILIRHLIVFRTSFSSSKAIFSKTVTIAVRYDLS